MKCNNISVAILLPLASVISGANGRRGLFRELKNFCTDDDDCDGSHPVCIGGVCEECRDRDDCEEYRDRDDCEELFNGCCNTEMYQWEKQIKFC